MKNKDSKVNPMLARSLSDAHFFLLTAVGFCPIEDLRQELAALASSVVGLYNKLSDAKKDSSASK